jgi:hypothetical protein
MFTTQVSLSQGNVNTDTLSKWLSRVAVAAGRSPAVAERKCLAY